jgi:glycogen synthase kinase 3 beta
MAAAKRPADLGVAGDSAAKRAKDGDLPLLEPQTYETLRLLGKGTFGHVYLCKVKETEAHVAIKSMTNPNDKDREVQVLKELYGHPNIVQLKGAFKMRPAVSGMPDSLNLVFEYLSDTLHRVIKHYNQIGRQMESGYVKLYQYQIVRGLNFMHSRGIAHCDLKPQNCLLDGKSHTMKICDFGTAKRLNFSEPRQLYVCSRYFRAPEVIFGSTNYNCSIDLWAAGCIMAEMVLGQPLFTGKDGIDQGCEIMKVLGTPTNAELRAMNPNYPRTYNFDPVLHKMKWDAVLKNQTAADGCELIDKLVCYDPAARLPPLCCMLHRYFDSLRSEHPKDNPQPNVPLFDFMEDELWFATASEREKLIPAWYTAKQERLKKEEIKTEVPGTARSSAPSSRSTIAAGSPPP